MRVHGQNFGRIGLGEASPVPRRVAGGPRGWGWAVCSVYPSTSAAGRPARSAAGPRAPGQCSGPIADRDRVVAGLAGFRP